MHKELPSITTIKLFDGSISAGPIQIFGPFDFTNLMRRRKFSINVITGGGGTIFVTDYRSPERDLLMFGTTLYYQYGTSHAERASEWRKCESGVATIKAALSSSALVGQFISIKDMSDSSYNGIHKVTNVIDTTTFSFDLNHADEAQTNDSAGKIQRLIVWSGSFPTIKYLPWAKFGVTCTFGAFSVVKVWINVQ